MSVPDLWCNDEVMPPIKDCRIRPESDHRITCHIRIRFDMLSHILFYESFCLIFCLPQSIFPVRIIACSVLVERGLLLLQTLFWTFRLSVSQYTNHLLEIIRNIYKFIKIHNICPKIVLGENIKNAQNHLKYLVKNVFYYSIFGNIICISMQYR